MTHPSKQVAVVGGGWGGLACAERLCTSTQAPRVSLFEAAPQLGGRARGLLWDAQAPIDAGQHLLIAAYTETLGLLRRAGALSRAHWQVDWLRWSSLGSGLGPGLGSGPHSGDSETLVSLLPDLLQAWPSLMRPPSPDESARAWLQRSGCSPRLMQHLLRPLAEAALNTDWSEASAWCLQVVLRDATRRGPLSLRILHPRRNLSLDGVEPIAQYLTRRGVQIHLRSRIVEVIATAEGRWTLRGPDGDWAQTFDEVVFAVPERALDRLLQGLHPPQASPPRGLPARAVGTLFLRLSPGERPHPSGEIRCFQDPDGESGPVIGLARPAGPWGQVLALVVSALPPVREDQDLGLARAQRAAQRWLGRQIPSESQWIVDRQATWAATPAAIARQRPMRAYHALGGGLWHCSDELVAGYPATIESAVRAGRAAAAALLA